MCFHLWRPPRLKRGSTILNLTACRHKISTKATSSQHWENYLFFLLLKSSKLFSRSTSPPLILSKLRCFLYLPPSPQSALKLTFSVSTHKTPNILSRAICNILGLNENFTQTRRTFPYSGGKQIFRPRVRNFPAKTGEALLLVGRMLLTPSHFLRSGNLWIGRLQHNPSCVSRFRGVQIFSSNNPPCSPAWQQAEMQRPAAICFKVEPFLPSGLSPLLQLGGKTLPEAQKVQ